LAAVLRKKVRLYHPMFYGRRGFVPYASREWLAREGSGDEEACLAKCQKTWTDRLDREILEAPEWLIATLKKAKRKRVTLVTTMTKWD